MKLRVALETPNLAVGVRSEGDFGDCALDFLSAETLMYP